MSQAVIHGNVVYLAGQVGAPGQSVTEQTKAILARIDELLALATELLDGPARGVDACKSYRASP